MNDYEIRDEIWKPPDLYIINKLCSCLYTIPTLIIIVQVYTNW